METPKDNEPPTPPQNPACLEGECDSSCSTLDPHSSQDEATFPFKLTPSGNFKINSNQVVFQSSTLGVLLADPNQAKVKVKLDSKGSSEECRLLKSDVSVKKSSKCIINKPVKNKIKRGPSASSKEEKGKELTSLGYIVSGPSDWQKERLCELPNKEDLLTEIYRRICNTVKPDTTVHILDEIISCHHIVLEVYSTYFAENLQRDVELPSKYVTAKAFQAAYNWMICTTEENQTITRDNVLDLYSAATFLGIKSLEQQCWVFMENEKLFTEDTAFAMFLKAKEKNLVSIAEMMVPRIKLFFLPLVASKDFVALSIEELVTILKSNEIHVTSEVEVLMAGVRWLFGDWQRRQQYILEVMRCVRFGLISPWNLVDVKRNPENEEIFDIINEPEVQQMIDDGLAYVIVKYWYGNNTKEFRHWIEILGLTEPVQRVWFGEEMKHVTYKDFLTYLQQYSLPKSEMMQKLQQMLNQKTDKTLVEIRGVNQKEMESRRQKYAPPPPPMLALNPEFLHDLAATKQGANNSAVGGGLETIREMVSPDYTPKKAVTVTKEATETKTERPKTAHQKPQSTDDTDLFYKPENTYPEDHPIEKQVKPLKQPTEVKKTVRQHDSGEVENFRFVRPSANQKGISDDEELVQGVELKKEQPERDGDGSSDNMEAVFKGLMINSDMQKGGEYHRLSEAACYLASTISKLSKSQEDNHRAMDQQAAGRSQIGAQVANNVDSSREPLYSKAFKVESFHMYNSKMFMNQLTDPRDKVLRKSASQLSDHEREQTPQISLFDYSKEDLAKKNLNKLSNSILAPSAKNYLTEGSLFSWDRETVIVFGGIDPHMPYGTNKNHGKDIYRFDPVFNVWENVGELPEPRHHHSVAFLRGRVYLVGGADPRDDDIRGKSVVVSTVWSFEPVTRSWYSESGLATPRKNFGLVVHKVALYAIGGQDKKGRVLRQVERFDPKTGMWKEVKPMRAPRMAVASIKYRDYIWVAGGMTGHKRAPLSKDVECYNSVTDEWTLIYSLRFPRCFASFFTMSDKLYLVGGAGKMSEKDKSASSVGAIDVWDWKHRVWKQETEMSIPRHGHAVAYLGTQIVIIGGVTTIYMRALSNVESYCCERSAWIRGVATIPLPLSGHGAVTLPPASLM